jgi:hypothetical protein
LILLYQQQRGVTCILGDDRRLPTVHKDDAGGSPGIGCRGRGTRGFARSPALARRSTSAASRSRRSAAPLPKRSSCAISTTWMMLPAGCALIWRRKRSRKLVRADACPAASANPRRAEVKPHGP